MNKHQENYDALVRMARRLQESGLEPLTEDDTISDQQYQFLCEQAQIIRQRAEKSKKPMKTETQPTHIVQIYLSGPLAVIEQTCRAFCLERGLCVTVEPTKFIYTGGEEFGACVGLLNYPRFPKAPHEINAVAEKLAERLLDETHQQSILIVRPDVTTWKTKRDE